ncbi:unnamed protein product, partial [Rotaria sp. Silwood2]
QATLDLHSSSTTSSDTGVPIWILSVDKITSLVNANDGIVNKGYESKQEEDTTNYERLH